MTDQFFFFYNAMWSSQSIHFDGISDADFVLCFVLLKHNITPISLITPDDIFYDQKVF